MNIDIYQMCEKQGAAALNVHNVGAGGVDRTGSAMSVAMTSKIKPKRVLQFLIRSSRKIGL